MKKYLSRVTEAWNLKSQRPFVDFALDIIEKHWNDKNIFIIEAPTGYGKSVISATLSLYSINEDLKCIVCYPVRTLIEDQYDCFTGKKANKNPIADLKLIGKRYMHNPDSKYLIKPITLTTVDTFALTLFGIAPEDFEKVLKAYEGISSSFGHYLFSWASAILSNVVLDEVHLLADSTKSLNFLIALMMLAVRFNQKLILMSATLPKSLKEFLIESLSDYIDKIVLITFSKSFDNVKVYSYFDKGFVKERERKDYEIELHALREDEKFERILDWIKDGMKDFCRIIAVFNTVDDAVRFYSAVLRDKEIVEFFGSNILLIHSRFTEEDKILKNELLKRLGGRYLIASTQVIEAGIDISSDLFVTEIAPANSLIQRLGRFLRFDERRGKVIVWYETDNDLPKINFRYDFDKSKAKVVFVDVNEEYYELIRERVKAVFENAKVKHVSQCRNRCFVVEPVYKVYSYDLVLKTLEWLKDERNRKRLKVHIPECLNDDFIGYKTLLDQVYGKDDFRVNRRNVDDLLKIHDHLENPKIAVETLINLEGSFVREDYQINIVPNRFVNEFIGKDEKSLSNLISKFCIPVSFSAVKSLNILGYLYVDRDGIVRMKELKERWILKNPRFVLLKGIVAFVADVEYDKDLGLVVRDDLRLQEEGD